MDNKYSALCHARLKYHLQSFRVNVADMFRKAPPVSSSRIVAPAVVSVNDFVEVDADRTPGWNSEGGIAMVIAVTDNFSDVK